MTKEEILAIARKAYEKANKKPALSLPVVVRPDDKNTNPKNKEKKASVNEAYERGFRKCAEAHGVDPQALARFILSKEASTDIWGKLKTWLDQAKEWYGKQDASTKALVRAGGGALIGGTLGSIFGGSKGFATGALIGGIGGAAANPLVEVFGNKNKPKIQLTPQQLESIRRAGYNSVTR